VSVDTVKVPAEDRNQVQAEVNGRRYSQRGGFFTMRADDAKLHLADAGYGRSWHVHGIASRRSGYTCPGCGFASFFRTCSRCKSECERNS